MGRKKQQKTVLPPALPPEVPEEEIEVSDEDLEFVSKNKDFAGFLTSLDTKTIDKHVNRVTDAKGKKVEDDALEDLYEKRLHKKAKEDGGKEKKIEVEPVDALPVKTLDGQLYYLNVKKPEDTGTEDGEAGDDQMDIGMVRLTKAEKRAKFKKARKEAKKLADHSTEVGETVDEEAPQAAALAEVKKDLTAEQVFESKKHKLAELGLALQADPEENIKFLKELVQLCRDDDPNIVKLSVLSLLAVFKSIIPGYRIRLPTDKELEMKVSKEVKKTRFYEATLLSTYKAYLQRLVALEKDSKFQHVAVRCLCTMLDAAPHFNFWEGLLSAVVANIGSPDDVIRRLSCDTVKSLFSNEGKHGGQATSEAVRMIADSVKVQKCQMHPDSIEVFMSLKFDEDLVKPKERESKAQYKKNKKRKNAEEPTQVLQNDRKRSKKEMMSQMREEVAADYKAAAFTPDVTEKIKMQTETLTAVFETSEANGNSFSTSHPLLSPCLSGLGKFSHLIDLDYIGDLMNYLKRLAGAGTSLENSSDNCVNGLTLSERLRCCIVAFRVMRLNLDALNVDLQGFFVQLYNIILEYRPGRDQGEVLADALKIMLCDDRHHDMQKAAAFAKRLATFSLCVGSAESMAALVTVRHLLLKNVKCRNLLENDSGGGSVSGMVARYHPYASDPNLSGALASVLWELNLLFKHYNPAISTAASGIASMSAAPGQAYLTINSPQQAFKDLSLEKESFSLPINAGKPSSKKNNKHNKGPNPRTGSFETDVGILEDEEELKRKFAQHFGVLEEVKLNERARKELSRTNLALQLYEEYKLQKKRNE
ncbi:Nucleolar complex-associated protein 3 [Linum grandiflorum]